MIAQTTVTGLVRDAQTRQPIPGAEVRLADKQSLSDAEGRFRIEITLPNQQVLLSVTKDGYLDEDRDVSLSSGGNTNVGVITLRAAGADVQATTEELIPTISLSNDDLDIGASQNVSGVLSASRDAFINAAAFSFGPQRFRIRGYDAPETEVFINGMPVNELETGRIFWSAWGGLNDVLRNRSIMVGLDAVPYAFGGMGGATDTDTRAALQRAQTRINYAVSNRTYRNRIMATHSTGMQENGWALSLSASRRWGEEGYIPGTFYDAYSYFMSVDRKLGDQHSLNMTVFGAPVKRGKGTASVQEMYDLAGTNFYNPNWGFQNGKVRNSRVADIHQPMGMIRHDWKISDKLNLISTVGGQVGRTGNSALDWYNANDPRPDYYRKLPSYIENEQAEAVAELLRTDEAARQINWDRMYEVNRNGLTTIQDAGGMEGNDVTGNRSQYIVEDRRTDSKRLNFSTNLEAFLSDKVTLNGGVYFQKQTIENFKVVDDLLGGDFYVDIDKFAEFDSVSTSPFIQSDISQPNRVVREGDRFGYDYDIHIQAATAWSQLDFSLPRFDFFVGLRANQTQFWRDGKIANGKFPDDSKGESERNSYFTYDVKGGITFKVDGRNYLFANGSYRTRAPFARDAFVSPRTRNQLVDDLRETTIFGVEGGYLLRSPNIKARAVGYFTQFADQTRTRSFYLDNAVQTADGTRGGFVNYIMTGLDTRHMGLELAAEVKINASLTAVAVAAIGEYIYTNRPQVAVYLDNQAQQLSERTVYIKNFYVAGTPQQAYTFGLNYNSPKFWFANVNFNYMTDRYIDFYPERRTIAAVSTVEGEPTILQEVINPDSPLFREIIEQERTDGAFTMDVFGGKSWKIKNSFIYLTLGVSNILDNKDIRTGGFEQFRFDFEGKDVGRFPSKYFYGFGRNYFVQLAYRL